MEARTAKSAPTTSGYVAINGLNYYYELHGRGEPLLHGGLGSIDMFGPVLSMLAETRQVVGVRCPDRRMAFCEPRAGSRTRC
jgi:hypothetical protein